MKIKFKKRYYNLNSTNFELSKSIFPFLKSSSSWQGGSDAKRTPTIKNIKGQEKEDEQETYL